MKKLWIWIISVLILIVLFFIVYKILSGNILLVNIPEECNNNPLIVKRVIDGDTFELCSGDKVRLLCVNTPEKGEEGYEDAQYFLENLLLYKEVRLESSNYQGNNTDKYNRLLRWVYVNDINQEILVNKYVLEEGYGDILIIPPETCNEVAD